MPRHQEVAGKLRHLYGWKRNTPDHRDAAYTIAATPLRSLPPSAGPVSYMPKIEDQGQEGSCTGNAGSSVIELLRKKSGLPEVQYSRQGLYFATRVRIEGRDPSEDSGASIRDTMKAMCTYGVGPEDLYPYTPENFSKEPGEAYWAEAQKHKLRRFNHCPTIGSIKTMLALGYPVQFGFSVQTSFLEATFDGYLKFPVADEGFDGSHSVYTPFYDDSIEIEGEESPGALLCVNSWGKSFGLKDYPGCFWMSYRHVVAGLVADACAPRLFDDQLLSQGNI